MTREKLQRNHEDYRRKVEEIRGDWTMSEAAKRQELDGLYRRARENYEGLTEEYRAGIRERLREGRKGVFSAPKVGTDAALNMLAYRDALDRTARVSDPRELSDMLARAEITGDRALARAVLYRGYNLPGEAAKTSIVQSYFAKYPDEVPKWDAFMEAAAEHNTLETMGTSAAVGVPAPEKPRELGASAPVGG
jgi:hypothetical protein